MEGTKRRNRIKLSILYHQITKNRSTQIPTSSLMFRNQSNTPPFPTKLCTNKSPLAPPSSIRKNSLKTRNDLPSLESTPASGGVIKGREKTAANRAKEARRIHRRQKPKQLSIFARAHTIPIAALLARRAGFRNSANPRTA